MYVIRRSADSTTCGYTKENVAVTRKGVAREEEGALNAELLKGGVEVPDAIAGEALKRVTTVLVAIALAERVLAKKALKGEAKVFDRALAAKVRPTKLAHQHERDMKGVSPGPGFSRLLVGQQRPMIDKMLIVPPRLGVKTRIMFPKVVW